MIRNRRSKVDIYFPKRRAAIYHLALSEAEWRLYADVTDYIRRRFRMGDSNKHLRLTLMTLQRELSSSPQAVAATLRKMVKDRGHGDATRAELRGFSHWPSRSRSAASCWPSRRSWNASPASF